MNEISNEKTTTMRIPSCRGLIGMLLGHDYRARYNEWKGAPILTQFEAKGNLTRIMDSLCEAKKDYLHDVCSRCGHTINRPATPNDHTSS